MKAFCFSLLLVVSSCVHKPQSKPSSEMVAEIISVSGKVFVGPETSQKSGPGCEGCGQPGKWSFSTDGSVELIDRGSDTPEIGTWTQADNVVTVKVNDRAQVVTFFVEDDGKTLLDSRSPVRYSLASPKPAQ